MIEYRIRTFLSLCETMNYRVTAQLLNLTQPAVTQHIQALEQEYGCRLFRYDGRRLQKTEAAEKLAVCARSMLYEEQALLRDLRGEPPAPLRIGATKTIGTYVIAPQLSAVLRASEAPLSLTVDNTRNLLSQVDRGELDFAMIEGAFDKRRYHVRLMRQEPFVGICAAGSPLAGKEVPPEALFSETLILREPGSGTRAIFEQLLESRGYETACFRRTVCISAFEVICRLVAEGAGISFVYAAVAASRDGLATFALQGQPVLREFNFVCLQGAAARMEPVFDRFSA